jgi:hypothetical protein
MSSLKLTFADHSGLIRFLKKGASQRLLRPVSRTILLEGRIKYEHSDNGGAVDVEIRMNVHVLCPLVIVE